MFTATLFVKAQPWKPPEGPSVSNGVRNPPASIQWSTIHKEEHIWGHAMYESLVLWDRVPQQSGWNDREVFYGSGAWRSKVKASESTHTVTEQYSLDFSLTFWKSSWLVSPHFWCSNDVQAHIPSSPLEGRQLTYSRMALS